MRRGRVLISSRVPTNEASVTSGGRD
jgi:hypothetical protein